MAERYRINDCFLSLQGEGARSGSLNVFLRFTGCNQTCRVESHGFDCDTEFASGRSMALAEVLALVKETGGVCRNVICTGGEPLLQLDGELVNALHAEGYFVAVETNGSVAWGFPDSPLDWVTVSPKVAEHAIRIPRASEVKYVRGANQGIPKTVVAARHQFVSPAFVGDAIDPKALANCIRLVHENVGWKLTVQQHKAWGVR